MRTYRPFFSFCFALSVIVSALGGILAPNLARAQGLKAAASLMPDNTQGFLCIGDFPRFIERWNATQFGKMLELPEMLEFWEGQKLEIENRLGDAGWKLNLHPEDIYAIASGQIALGWMAVPDDLRKPFGIALIVDMAGREEETQELLQRVEAELQGLVEIQEVLQVNGHSVTHYKLKRKPGELVQQESFYCVIEGQLFASDNLETLSSMVTALDGDQAGTLAGSEVYQKSFANLSQLDEATADLQYYVRPIGMARVLRSISRKPNKRGTDVLQVLENQGFDKLEAVCGRVQLGSANFDIRHDGFVACEEPRPRSVQILDFPNNTEFTIPGWVGENTASIFALSWNVQEAFWKVDGLVDEMIGNEDAFDNLIKSIRDDIAGPQIDIEAEVMPLLTDEIYAVGDCIEPITPDSRRSLIALRIQDAKKMSEILERALVNDSDARAIEFEGQRIWTVSRVEDEELDFSIDSDFGGFDSGFSEPAESSSSSNDETQPWLNNWAMTVLSVGEESFLFFASGTSVIEDAIRRSVNSTSELSENAAVTQVISALQQVSTRGKSAVWHMSLNDRAFQMQYELFRQGKLPESRSMLASLLDRLINAKSDVSEKKQKVDGNKLPPYEDVREYLMPSGSVVESVANGWSVQSFVLSGNAQSSAQTSTSIQTANDNASGLILNPSKPDAEVADRSRK